MEKTHPNERKIVESDTQGLNMGLMDEYFKHQSPLAQLVEIKGAFLRMLRLIDDANEAYVKLNRRTANTNSRLTQVEAKIRELREELQDMEMVLDQRG